MTVSARPYCIDIPECELVDLRERLNRTRWASRETVTDTSQGLPLEYLRELCRYWATGYDWAATQRRLNAYEQAMVTVDGLDIHTLHVRSPHAGAMALLLTHGWPGSIVEFLDVIGPLTDPAAYGGDPADAFHLVLPSLPGYGFSAKPTRPGWGVEKIADAWATLMAALGYQRYGAAGGDWGAQVATTLAVRHPDPVIGLHLVYPIVDLRAAVAAAGKLEPAETAALEAAAIYRRSEAGYATQQSTRPQTLGYGLVDSPAGQAAWIMEKFFAWTDSGGHPENVISRDALLDNVMFYWLPAAAASSAQLYWESFGRTGFEPVTVPTGCSIFPRELIRPSRRFAETRYTDIRYWNEPAKGGHFASFEQPASYVEEIRAFYRLVR